MTDIPTIASKLTSEGRAALLASAGNGLWGDGRFDYVGARRAGNELIDLGLAECAEPNGLWACYRLNELGLSVRTHLQKEASK